MSASPNSVLIAYYNPALDFACGVLDLDMLSGALVLRFLVNDGTTTALPGYSIDGGATFKDLGGWGVPASAGAIWTYSGHAYSSVFAAYEVPAPSSTSGAAAALLAFAGLARRRER